MRWGRSSRGQDWKVPWNIRERVYVRPLLPRMLRGAVVGLLSAGLQAGDCPGTGRATHSAPHTGGLTCGSTRYYW